jgi:hypothetical protein
VRTFVHNVWSLPASTHPLPTDRSLSKRIHFCVEWLTNDLCKEWEGSRGSMDFATLPLLREEKVRIYQAFYRLHFLTDLYRATKNSEWEDTRHWILHLLPLWEVEELLCVYEYLHQKLGSLFDLPWDNIIRGNGMSSSLSTSACRKILIRLLSQNQDTFIPKTYGYRRD